MSVESGMMFPNIVDEVIHSCMETEEKYFLMLVIPRKQSTNVELKNYCSQNIEFIKHIEQITGYNHHFSTSFLVHLISIFLSYKQQ